MSTELLNLVDLIATQVRTIEDICSPKQTKVPSVDDATGAIQPDVMKEPGFVQAADLAIAAATRLIAMLRDPVATLCQTASGMYGSALLNVVVETNITEALREAGPKGLHVCELAPKVGMDPMKLARVLRYLSALHYIYREVEPDVFANNRISQALDTGKSFDMVKDRKLPEYVRSEGLTAFIAHETDVCLKGAAELSNTLLDPTTAFSSERSKSATMKALGYDSSWFEWLSLPEQKKKSARYGEAVSGLKNILFPKGDIYKQFQWDELPAGSVVVDVGGEISNCTLPLAKSYPDLQFVVQAPPSDVAEAEKYLNDVAPEAVESGLIKIQAHNILEDQPVGNASVFLLCAILHNRPNLEAAQILRHLHEAATQDTRLIIVDPVVPYSCPVRGDISAQNVPEVLRGNAAAHHGLLYIMDLQVMNLTNSQERTIGQWDSLTKACGWSIEAIHPGTVHAIICSPTRSQL